MEFHRTLCQLLAPTGEARALMLMLLEYEAHLTTAQVLAGEADRLPTQTKLRLEQMARRAADGEPIQYILGIAPFCGLHIGVAPGVLIPRPETEELVANVLTHRPQRVLDLCTGSGCIALALRHHLPGSEVWAVDNSDDALRIARKNADTLALDVHFICHDVLAADFPAALSAAADAVGTFDAVVSNPPYVCQSEAATMQRNVLDFEPHCALFVPDDDPLRFYAAIARHAQHCLSRGGHLFFELNAAHADATAALVAKAGYDDVAVKTDAFDRPRILQATWNGNANP